MSDEKKQQDAEAELDRVVVDNHGTNEEARAQVLEQDEERKATLENEEAERRTNLTEPAPRARRTASPGRSAARPRGCRSDQHRPRRPGRPLEACRCRRRALRHGQAAALARAQAALAGGDQRRARRVDLAGEGGAAHPGDPAEPRLALDGGAAGAAHARHARAEGHPDGSRPQRGRADPGPPRRRHLLLVRRPAVEHEPGPAARRDVEDDPHPAHRRGHHEGEDCAASTPR
jgi:hypothetical protein